MLCSVCKVNDNWINLTILCTQDDGQGFDPDAVVAKVYQVSQTDGSLSLVTSLGVNGVITLTKLLGETGLYGAGVNTSSLEHGRYVILFKITEAGTVYPVMETFDVNGGLESAVAVLIGNAVYDQQTKLWQVYAQDGQTIIAQITQAGVGIRTGSQINAGR